MKNSLRCCLFLVALASSTSLWAEQMKPNTLTQEILQSIADSSSGFADNFDAEVWMVDMNHRLARYVKDTAIRFHILKKAHTEASRHGLDPQLVLSVMHVESLFDHFALSYAGAQGLMQVMPFWKKELKKPNANLFDIDTNIEFGTIILKTYLTIEKGNEVRALARYNGSLGKTWYPKKVFTAHSKYWKVAGGGR